MLFRSSKGKNELHWEATKTLNDMCKDSWKYIQNRKNNGRNKNGKISVVVSCYNEEKALPLFYEEMERVRKKILKE